ncbi:heterokaryon incompatibility protein-domain-containing protein [Whalleya microplaca]|nr:heterokaryon incompatibility protein-domain-containing protein [Whalleya microplaca]
MSSNALSEAARSDESSSLDYVGSADPRRSLCDVCKRLDLSRIFMPSATDPDVDFSCDGIGYRVSWEITEVRRSSGRCIICHMLLKALGHSRAFDTVESGTIYGFLDSFAVYYPPGSSSGPQHFLRRLWDYASLLESSGPAGRSAVYRILEKDEDNYYTRLYGQWYGDNLKDRAFASGPTPALKSYKNRLQGRRLQIFVDTSQPWRQRHGVDNVNPIRSSRQTESSDLYNHCIQLAGQSSVDPQLQSPLHTRAVISSRQDFGLIRTWMSRCHSEHGIDCQPYYPSRFLGFTLRVIDVEDGCVREAPSECHYIALSYVWGRVEQLSLTSSTYEDLSKPTALSRSSGIPSTIRDAMTMCRRLGERYLWVDTLCIIQDSDTDKSEQISHMDEIYAGAVLTIVNAGASSANDPIPGVECDSNSRIPGPSHKVGGLQLSVVTANISTMMSQSAWEQRGWTFQENVLSKRLLVVTESLTFFRCAHALWREDRVQEPQHAIVHEFERYFMEPQRSNGDIRKDPERLEKTVTDYIDIVKVYPKRRFSNEADILLAFEGIQQTMLAQIGAFFWGLPKRYMNTALLWNSAEPGLLERRPGFPSWSWAGWKNHHGDISFAYRIDQMPLEIAFFELEISGEAIAVVPQPASPRMRGHVDSTDVPEFSSRYVRDSLPISTLQQLLVFYTNAAKLRVDMEPRWANTNIYRVQGPISLVHPEARWQDGRVIPALHRSIDETIELRPEWRKRQPEELEFIEMHHVPGATSLRLMLIEWVDNVAYRVVLLDKLVNYEDWLACGPTEKLIMLG